jgi:hypothetical protein
MDEITARAHHIFWFADDVPDYPVPAGQAEFEVDLIARLAGQSPELYDLIYWLKGHSRAMTPRGFHLLFKAPDGSIDWPLEKHATIDGPDFWLLPGGEFCMSMFHIDSADTARLEGVIIYPGIDWPQARLEAAFDPLVLN